MAGMRILIADDNLTLRSMMHAMISKMGLYEIDVAENGIEALRIYRQNHHDLMLIDNIMPEMDGIQVLRELKNDPLIYKTHVIMITGTITRELALTIRSEVLKIDDIVVKPVDFQKLKAKVTDVSNQLRRRSPNRGPVLVHGDKGINETTHKPTLTSSVTEIGNIAVINLVGSLINFNKSTIKLVLGELQSIIANTVVIDINAVDSIDEFGIGTLAVMGGWLSLNDKEVFISLEDCPSKEYLASLGISRLVPKYPDPSCSLSAEAQVS